MKMKRLLSFILVIALFLLIFSFNSNYNTFTSRVFNTETSRLYKEAISIMEDDYLGYNNILKVTKNLYRFSDEYERKRGDELVLDIGKYKDARSLYYYAKAFESFTNTKNDNRTSCELAMSNLNKIPIDYNGKFSDKIAKFREKVLAENEVVQKNIKEDHQKYEEEQKLRDSKIYIGDTGFKVLNIMGEPIRKNITTTAHGTREQWVYGSGTYIYLENGTVTSWQTSE